MRAKPPEIVPHRTVGRSVGTVIRASLLFNVKGFAFNMFSRQVGVRLCSLSHGPVIPRGEIAPGPSTRHRNCLGHLILCPATETEKGHLRFDLSAARFLSGWRRFQVENSEAEKCEIADSTNFAPQFADLFFCSGGFSKTSSCLSNQLCKYGC